jgi:hypothetical protein
VTAKFKAASTFTITGRGLVLAGEILEGFVKIGMKVRVPSYSQDLTINGISPIHNVQNPSLVGLLFSSHDENESIRWQGLDLQDRVLEVFDESS